MHVRLESVTFHYPGSSPLFDAIDWKLKSGVLYGLVGPSGCGKSTVLSLIAAVLAPCAGSIEWNGINKTLWVLQSPFGVARRTALDHVALPLLAKGFAPRSADSIALNLLSRFKLTECADRTFETLSGGESQRLMLARALAVAPDLYLIDEPTAELDRVAAAEVNAVLREMVHDGAIVVVATHDHATRSFCDEVLDLGNPRTVGTGS